MTIKIASLATSFLTFIGIIFIIYHYFRNPDIQIDKKVDLMDQGCKMTHNSLNEKIANINEHIAEISKTFSLFQQNEFKHIEDRMTALEKGQTIITTILDERLPRK